MFEGGKTPWLPPAELYAMGFSQLLYPSYVLLRMAFAIDRALVELRGFADGKCPLPGFADYDAARMIFQDAVRLSWWQAFEDRLFPTGPAAFPSVFVFLGASLEIRSAGAGNLNCCAFCVCKRF